MGNHDVDIILNQMMSHAVEIVEITRGKQRSDLDSDRF